MKIPDAPPVRMTRARAREMEEKKIAAAAKPAAVKGRGRPKAATTTKKALGDPQMDKENRPVAGLRAKPVRRPAAPRGAKKVSGGPPPLSPKKATQTQSQVAGPGSDSTEEDELNGAKTPIRPLNIAKKRVSSGCKTCVVLANKSPTLFEPRGLATPAKRPRSSPGKASVKAPPKKLVLESSPTKPALKPTKTPSKMSLLQSPARRTAAATPRVSPPPPTTPVQAKMADTKSASVKRSKIPTPTSSRSVSPKIRAISSRKYTELTDIPVEKRSIPTTPARLYTPAKVFTESRVIHTISKVPLRPAGGMSSSLIPRKKSSPLSDSVSAPTTSKPNYNTANTAAVEQSIDPAILNKENITPTKSTSSVLKKKYKTPTKPTPIALTQKYKTPTKPTPIGLSQGCKTPIMAAPRTPFTPYSGSWSTMATPARTPRRVVDPDVLKGAVVYVDVHTSEGEDASEIFVELLIQMGARCVKNWPWIRQSTLIDSDQTMGTGRNSLQGNTREAGRSVKKIGITHVIFKDGGKRTLEKVRDTDGVVHCVGVSWVLDCERKNKWVDETNYAVDISMVPRGGQRRRKSMEPRALLNINGSLVPTSSPRKIAELSPTKEFLTFDSPTTGHESLAVEPPEPVPATPALYHEGFEYSQMTFDGSPTTPYYLSKGAELVQQTCPPKQTQQLLFPLSGRIEDQPDEMMRQRLLLARRKTLQWAPKCSSPLSTAVLSAL